MKRFYKKIDSTLELKTLDDLAATDGKEAVGISNSGSLYKWNREAKKAEKISSHTAEAILDVSSGEIEKIIETRGLCEIEEIQEETIIPDPVITVLVEEEIQGVKQEHNDSIMLIQELRDEVKNIREEFLVENSNLKNRIEILENALTELKSFIILD